MLNSGEIERLSMALDKPMRTLEYQIMSDIIRRIKENGGEITRAVDWQIYRLHELGVAQEDINKAIQEALDFSDEDMQEMYRKIIEEGYAYDSKLYEAAGVPRIPFEENKELQQLISAIGAQTSNECKNITQSLGFAIRNPDGTLSFQPIATYYQQTLDNAVMGIASGVFDYNTVIKKVVSELTNSGLRTVDYETGWSNRTDVAARRAIMTGLSQLTAKVNESNAKELETDMFETSWHSGARPTHQEWQGKWYTHKELVEICGLGSVTGLCGANCYHDYYPVIPGISKPTYSDEELKRMNAEENVKREYRGKEYTKYEALQRQRRLETTMRAERQKIKLLEEGGADEDDILAAKARYKGTSHEYAEFSKAMELPQQRQRVYTGTVDKNSGSGIINIGRSVGAMAHVDTVFLPEGTFGKLQEGSSITKVVVFAGKGTNKPVNVAPYLSKEYNVAEAEWKKVRGEGYVKCPDGTIKKAELHWFEADEIGRVKMKVKRWFL